MKWTGDRVDEHASREVVDDRNGPADAERSWQCPDCSESVGEGQFGPTDPSARSKSSKRGRLSSVRSKSSVQGVAARRRGTSSSPSTCSSTMYGSIVTHSSYPPVRRITPGIQRRTERPVSPVEVVAEPPERRPHLDALVHHPHHLARTDQQVQGSDLRMARRRRRHDPHRVDRDRRLAVVATPSGGVALTTIGQPDRRTRRPGWPGRSRGPAGPAAPAAPGAPAARWPLRAELLPPPPCRLPAGRRVVVVDDHVQHPVVVARGRRTAPVCRATPTTSARSTPCPQPTGGRRPSTSSGSPPAGSGSTHVAAPFGGEADHLSRLATGWQIRPPRLVLQTAESGSRGCAGRRAGSRPRPGSRLTASRPRLAGR